MSSATCRDMSATFPAKVEDLLVEGPRSDCMPERDQEAVLGHSHLVLTLLHLSVDAKYYVGVVVDSVGIVGDREGVFCLD